MTAYIYYKARVGSIPKSAETTLFKIITPIKIIN
jgi:hypothetical protein